MDECSGTTLITFLLRTPPDVRSVKLLGSWDNFTREYGMEKDSRMGRGHWRGCHTFKNIICDGKIHSSSRKGRNGALKMGATYWYYYRLDDDIDFHNDAQPSTTSCPFLPGQSVNILSVPIYLPSVERRGSHDDNAGCATPTHQTMNPNDKYTNPRPPPRPKLPRLTTSPGLFLNHGTWSTPAISWPKRSAHGRSSSHPSKLQSPGRFRRRNSKLPLTSESDLEGPFKEGVTNIPISKPSRGPPAQKNDCRRLEDPVPRTRLCSSCSSPLKSRMDMPSANLHTYSRAKSGERRLSHRRGGSSPSPRRAHAPSNRTYTDRLSLPRNDSIDSCSVYSRDADVRYNLEQDAFSLKDTYGLVTRKTPSSIDLNSKRLPTPLNSPSSILDEDKFFPFGPDRNSLQSHFSAWTTETSESPYLPEIPEQSHFSPFNVDLDAISPCSMTSASTFNSERPHSPGQLKLDANHPSLGSQASFDRSLSYQELSGRSRVPSHFSNHQSKFKEPNCFIEKRLDTGTITSPSITTRRRYYEEEISPCSSPPPPFRIPTYRSHSFSKASDDYEQNNNNEPTFSTPRTGCSEKVQSMMQELIDEMSYLANMIRDGGTEAY